MELEARKNAILASLADWEQQTPDQRKTMTIQYHGQSRVIPVISVSPSVVLLNHDNYRLAAQLEDHPDKSIVLGAPVAEGSQALLAKLLSSTEEFKALKAQLAELKQREPGLVTREGLLVNGNTRAVALRELGSPGLLVGLLPDAVSSEDVLNLQVELQMVRLVHQDYTFTNELLLIDKLRSLPGADADGICRKLGWKIGAASRKKLEQKARILRLIKEIRSEHKAGMLPFSFFDDKGEMLENLDTTYEKQKDTDFSSAEVLKWTRVSGMLSSLTKDQVRAIDINFLRDQVKPRIPENKVVSSLAGPSESIFGLSPDLAAVKSLAANLVNKRFDENGQEVILLSGPEHEVGLEMQLAAEQKINEKRLDQILTDPIKHFREARLKFEDISAKLAGLALDESFDFSQFQQELEKVTVVLKKISSQANSMKRD